MASKQLESFWHRFKRDHPAEPDRYDVVSFGDDPQMASELADLVVIGRKRATASLLRSYDEDRAPLPRAGDLFVVIDGGASPRCVCRTVEVRVGPFSSVDDRFAYDEGEGDRSLGAWKTSHETFFGRAAMAEGFVMHDAIETVFERFTVVWPAQPPRAT